MKSALIAIASFVVVVVVAALAYAYSGAYDVSATIPDNAVVAWLLETARDRSVEAHAAGLAEPGDLANPQNVRRGAGHYRDDCQTCHGAPGNYPGPTGKGLNPQPPKLFGEDPDRPSAGEYYWVVMHGIKMTGMPSWENKYKPADAWAIVAFLQELPHLTPQQYQEMTAAESGK